MLNIEHVYAGYGDLKVLFDVSLHVDSGEVVSLVGANGAGKTTLLRNIAGLAPVTSGRIEFDPPAMAWSLDGDRVDTDGAVEIENLHSAYRLITAEKI